MNTLLNTLSVLMDDAGNGCVMCATVLAVMTLALGLGLYTILWTTVCMVDDSLAWLSRVTRPYRMARHQRRLKALRADRRAEAHACRQAHRGW